MTQQVRSHLVVGPSCYHQPQYPKHGLRSNDNGKISPFPCFQRFRILNFIGPLPNTSQFLQSGIRIEGGLSRETAHPIVVRWVFPPTNQSGHAVIQMKLSMCVQTLRDIRYQSERSNHHGLLVGIHRGALSIHQHPWCTPPNHRYWKPGQRVYLGQG